MMKKTFAFLLVMMATVGITFAQDIYSAGYYNNNLNQQMAGVYKNNELLYHAGGSNENRHESSSVVLDPATNDVYWVDNAIKNDDGSHYFGDVFKNNLRFLSNPPENRSHIYKLFWSEHENNVFAVGSTRGVGTDKKYACVWKGNDSNPLYAPNFDDGTASYALDLVVVGSDVYYCGIKNNQGVVWRNNEVLYVLEAPYSGGSTSAIAIACWHGDIYVAGQAGSNSGGVWKNGQWLYSLNVTSDDGDVIVGDIDVEGGDVYVSGYMEDLYDPDRHSICIWKNGSKVPYCNGDIYDYYIEIPAIEVNSQGVYYVYGRQIESNIYYLYTPDECAHLNDICVVPEPCENIPFTVSSINPYFNGFEISETDWECWTVTDGNEAATGTGSGWERHGENPYPQTDCIPYEGDYFVHCNKYDDSWLISPQLYLLSGEGSPKLSFQSWKMNANDPSVESVQISTTTTNPEAFTQLWTLTGQTTQQWTPVEIDLSAYEGQYVYIAFRYRNSGSGDFWGIDNVNVFYGEDTNSNAYDFEDGTFQGWTTIDADGDGHNWLELDGSGHNGSNYYLASESYDNITTSPLTPDNYLVSPQLELGGSISFWACAMDGNYPEEHFGVAVSTTSNTDPSAFTTISTWTLTAKNRQGTWYEYTADLSAYAGHSGYVAIRHFDCTDQYIICVDDITFTDNGGTTQHYTLTATANPTEGGTVRGGGTYPAGTSVTLTAIPNQGFAFDHWSDDSRQNPRNIIVNSDINLVAFFKPTSVNEFGETVLNVYPNPVNEKLRIEGLETETEIQIYNSLGMMVKTLTVNAEAEINVSDLSAGLYMIRCGDQTLRFVKE